MRSTRNRTSVQSAYKSLMAGFDDIPSKESVIMERVGRIWIWEFVLKRCSNSALIKALVEAFPIPDSSFSLKRMLLLKSLSFDVSDDCISERSLETISALREVNKSDGRSDDCHNGRRSVSLKDLHVAVQVECTVQHLRQEVDDWPKFCAALEKHWGDYIEDTEDREDDASSPANLQLRKELWDVQKQPELRHALLQKYKRSSVKKMLKSFLADEWRNLGPVFLEDVVDNLSKGLYVPSSPINISQARKADDSIRVPPVVLQTPAVQTEEQGQERVLGSAQMQIKESSKLQNAQDERAKAEANRHENVPVSVQTERENNLLSTSAEDQGVMGLLSLGVGANSGYGYNLRNRGKSMKTDAILLHENIWIAGASSKARLSIHEEEAPLASKPNEKGNNLHAGEIHSREDEVPGIAKFHKNMPSGLGDDSADAHLKPDILPQEDEPCSPSLPPWAGSPGIVQAVSSRSKRRKFDSLFFEDNHSSKSVPTPAPSQGTLVLETPEILKAQSELKEGQAHLNAVVKDPLPEALHIAEEAARGNEFVTHSPKISDSEATLHVDGTNQGTAQSNQNTMPRVLPPHIGGSGIEQIDKEKGTKRSLMDRHPTAQTFEWETNDERANSADDKSPSSSRQIRLPRFGTRRHFSLQVDKAASTETYRRKHNRWTQEEENILRKEVARYGKGRWKLILQKHNDVFENRTEVDLKDKWRNIERREGSF